MFVTKVSILIEILSCTFQRNKFVKKPLGGNPRSNSGALVIQESEFRNNLSHLLDTEAERNRILARNGYSSDWRSDVATPNSKRTLSAQGQRKDGGEESNSYRGIQ